MRTFAFFKIYLKFSSKLSESASTLSFSSQRSIDLHKIDLVSFRSMLYYMPSFEVSHSGEEFSTLLFNLCPLCASCLSK